MSQQLKCAHYSMMSIKMWKVFFRRGEVHFNSESYNNAICLVVRPNLFNEQRYNCSKDSHVTNGHMMSKDMTTNSREDNHLLSLYNSTENITSKTSSNSGHPGYVTKLYVVVRLQFWNSREYEVIYLLSLHPGKLWSKTVVLVKLPSSLSV